MSELNIEQLIRETDALVFFNALKAALAELKEEHATIKEMHDYQVQAIERANKLMRRIDNQYRAIVKTAKGHDLLPVEQEVDPVIEQLMEGTDV